MNNSLEIEELRCGAVGEQEAAGGDRGLLHPAARQITQSFEILQFTPLLRGRFVLLGASPVCVDAKVGPSASRYLLLPLQPRS